VKDDILPNGIPIYAGEMIAWNLWDMGRDETIWGDDAKQFNPDRWLNNEFKPNPFKFISFHAGPRIWYVYYFFFLSQYFIKFKFFFLFFFFKNTIYIVLYNN